MSKSIKEITRAVKASTGKTPAQLLLEQYQKKQASELKTGELTQEEQDAIERLETVIREFPKSLFLETEFHQGRVVIYKRTSRGEAVQVRTVRRKCTFTAWGA